jgi:hypothetical protein
VTAVGAGGEGREGRARGSLAGQPENERGINSDRREIGNYYEGMALRTAGVASAPWKRFRSGGPIRLARDYGRRLLRETDGDEKWR